MTLVVYGLHALPGNLAKLLAVVTAVAADAGGVWEPRATLNQLRQETAAARIGDNVYVLGGLVAGGPTQNTNTVEAYDISDNTWSTVAPLPFGVDHMGCAAANGIVYCIGGFDLSRAPRTDVNAYNPMTNSWTPVAPLPEPRGGCWAAEFDGKIYLFGGTNAFNSATATTFIYDPAEDEWTRGEDMPTRREHLMAVTAGRHIYVIGGRVGAASTTANERYNPRTGRWREMAPMPTARAAAFMGSLDGIHIYVAGGETPQLFSVNEVYDVVRNEWRTDTPMTVPRHGLAGIPIPGGILAAGGGLVQGLQATNHVDLFVPEEASLPAESAIAHVCMVLTVIAAMVWIAERSQRQLRD